MATDVERLLDRVKPQLMVTDPPYGVDYDPAWRNKAGAAATRRTGKVLNDHRADWREAWALFPGDIAYVWHGALHAATVAESLEAAGFAIRSQIIWAKERLVLSPRRLPLAARALLVRGEARPARATGRATESRPRSGASRAATRTPRPCTAPRSRSNACAARSSTTSSPGQAVYDPFIGSGTTLIAAETTGRICLGIELNPAYVDVAIERWQRFTGQHAIFVDRRDLRPEEGLWA